MKILYLTRNMSGYKGATYQREFLAALELSAEVHAWGPGYQEFDQHLIWSELKARLPWQPDVLMLGHSWLADGNASRLNPQPSLDLTSVDLPKVFILNKEYARLTEKLTFARSIHPLIVASHHHDVEKFATNTGGAPHFMPFAVAKNRFSDPAAPKDLDLTFTGILQNPTYPSKQTDFRLRAQSAIFRTVHSFPVVRRNTFKDFRIRWHPFFGDRRDWLGRLARRPRLAEEEYWALMSRSKTVLNGLSPLGLVGTRYFETLASHAIPVAESSAVYDHIPGLGKFLLPVEANTGALHELLGWVNENPYQMQDMANRGATEVWNRHTWEVRVEGLLESIRNEINAS